MCCSRDWFKSFWFKISRLTLVPTVLLSDQCQNTCQQPSQDVKVGTECLRDVFNPVSQPPLVKTQTVTISDMSSNVKSEIPTKEVPIVHTETKTITYEAAQVRCVLINFLGA